MPQTDDHWPDLYRQAIFEPDRRLLLLRIDAARQAIRHRARELWYAAPTETKERRDLDNAIYFLGLLGRLAGDP
jgi:hypothetical protein